MDGILPMKPLSQHQKVRALGRRNGFTFIEVMMSALVVGVTLGGVLFSVLFATRLNYLSSQRFAAFQLCKERVEELRETRFEDFLDDFDYLSGRRYRIRETDVPLTLQGPSGEVILTGTRETLVWDYSPTSANQGGPYSDSPHYLVRVRFDWQSITNLRQGRSSKRMEVYARIYPR